LAEVIAQAGNLHARIIGYISIDHFLALIQNNVWTLRLIPLLLVQAFIVFHVLGRIIKSKKGIKVMQNKGEYCEEILIVEDNESVLDIINRTFNISFPEVKVHNAGRYSEAFELLNANPNINLIITDMRLPGRSGFELCTFIKEERPWMIVIGMTGYQDDFELWNARNMGFDDYFIKPFRMGDLVNAVERELNKLARWKTVRTNDPCYNADKTGTENVDLNKMVGNKHKKKRKGDK
jgi:CheY-like chemotaxis protein